MARVVFVADLFLNDYVGGAELTTEALVEACPFEFVKYRSREITVETLQHHVNDYWIFGNFSGLNSSLIPSIVGNIRYSVLEYDYKFCKYRSIEKHLHETGEECNCDESQLGKMISAFFSFFRVPSELV